ncbi:MULTISPECIES: AAA family ATPase [Burkholderiaceae]|uniref:AAA family ATPase n=1 Tax=Burkholderiaceae TaxID=119060 RepID=UPI00095AEE2A|nr:MULTISPECIES: AAA family ATPase [Burkholderiaceae]MCG1019948.1 AAA family ATPase [Mycetohabitans sp. B4]SIT81547.1 Predicted ATPase [Burkholderia sp. b13]
MADNEFTYVEHFHVITGGPGSGKSTLLDALQAAGYARSVEAGRGVIQDQVRIGGPALPWHDPALFAQWMLCWEMRSYHLARERRVPVLFDRGVPDIVGYLRLCGLPVPAHVLRAAQSFRYNRQVFIAPPWREIFVQDVERKQDFDEARRTYDVMVSSYDALGYRLVELPCGPVSERARFVIEQITRGDHRGGHEGCRS